MLIFDEIFVGFRLAPGGAQEYFGVQPDLITYGKTLGGGLPVGVLCGRARLMKRYRDDRPVDVCFARGTFNSHPYVMGAMNEFLHRLETPEIQRAVSTVWTSSGTTAPNRLNGRCGEAELPVRVANLSSIWTVCYTRPSRYNWMLQYYLRAEGLALSWVGTGTADLQPELHRCGFRCGRGPFLCGGQGDGAATAGGGQVVPPRNRRSGAGSCARCWPTIGRGFGSRLSAT